LDDFTKIGEEITCIFFGFTMSDSDALRENHLPKKAKELLHDSLDLERKRTDTAR